MTMKIDGNRPTVDTEAAEAARRSALERRVQTGGTVRPADGSQDRVEVSADAQLLAAAVAAAEDAPAIRTDLVERMKQKLNAGEVGQDSRKLADSLIDDLLNR